MVARGDMGVEIPIENVPIIQKNIIKKCNQAGENSYNGNSNVRFYDKKSKTY